MKGLFVKEGWLAGLDEHTAYWDNTRGATLINLETGERTDLGLPGSKSPSVVVASADRRQVVICETGGWVRLLTLNEGKKAKAQRVRLHTKLPLSGAGFTAEHLVLRSAYPDKVATLYDRTTLEKLGTVKSKTVAGVAASGAVLDVSKATSLWSAPFKKAQPLAKHALTFISSTFDGATLLTYEREKGEYVTVDVVKGAVVGRLHEDKLASGRDDLVLPLDAKHVVHVRLKRPKHDLQEVTVEVWTLAAKKLASLELTFDASKSERGIAEQILVTPAHIILNAETAIDLSAVTEGARASQPR